MIQKFDLVDYRTAIPIAQIQYLPDFFNEDEINGVIGIAQAFEYQNGEILGQHADTDILVRQSKIKWLACEDDHRWLMEKINKGVKGLNNEIWDFDLFGINEQLQYTEYHSLESHVGYYDWHLDVSHEGLASNRKLTFECMLDDKYSGGELSIFFGPVEHKVKMKKGDAIVFPSFLLNKVYPVESGTRISLVGWVSGPSFR